MLYFAFIFLLQHLYLNYVPYCCPLTDKFRQHTECILERWFIVFVSAAKCFLAMSVDTALLSLHSTVWRLIPGPTPTPNSYYPGGLWMTTRHRLKVTSQQMLNNTRWAVRDKSC